MRKLRVDVLITVLKITCIEAKTWDITKGSLFHIYISNIKHYLTKKAIP